MKIAVLVAVAALYSLAQADVQAVRREVARINASTLTVKHHESYDLSAEGARIYVYRDARKRPRKIVAHVYGESGQAHDTIYLRNGLPLFSLRVEERYKTPLGLTSSREVGSRIETRLYFERGHLLEKCVGQANMVLSAAQKRTIEQQTRVTVQKYLIASPHR